MIDHNTSPAHARHRVVMFLLVGAALVGVMALVWTVDPLDLWATHNTPEDLPVDLQAEGDTLESPMLRGAATSPDLQANPTGAAAGNDRRSMPEKTRANAWEDPGRKSPPGTLEIIVMRNRQPASRGVAQLWHFDFDTTRAHDPRTTPLRTGTWNIEGSVMFRDLAQGGYVPSIRSAGGSTTYFPMVVVSDIEPNHKRVLHIGTRRVTGTVYDHDGNPAEDAPVVAQQTVARRRYTTHSRTDSLGRYSLGLLSPGPVSISAALHDVIATRASYLRVVMIGADDLRDVSFGSRAGRHVVSGVVQCTDGTPVRGPGVLRCAKVSPPGDQPPVSRFRYDEHGRFEQHLERGEYKVRIQVPGSEHAMPGFLVEVRSEQRSLQWIVPGARIVGHALFKEGDAAPSGGSMYPSYGRVSGNILPDGAYSLYGLSPGAHRVRVIIPGFGFMADETITVPPDTDEVTHNFTLSTK